MTIKKIIFNIVLLLSFGCVEEVPPLAEDIQTPPSTEMPAPTPSPMAPPNVPAVELQISDIQILDLKETSVKITWKTNLSASSQIEFGATRSLGVISSSSNLTTNHERVLSGLKDNTIYYYRIKSINDKEVVSSIFSFTTLKKVDVPDPMLKPQAAIIASAKIEGKNSYRILFSQPSGSLVPAGGYDTYINGEDKNDSASYSNYSRLVPNLDTSKKQCFKFEARYTQLTPSQFIQSNEICVDAIILPPKPEDNSGPLLAFPGAKGFGRNATGGRGGRVIKVTNLNDSGAGSLRAAITAKGSRIVVFDVGGEIKLENELDINVGSENLTIAGETAPFPGISVRNYGFDVHASNIIIRYITVRVGGESFKKSAEERDCFRIRNWGIPSNYVQENIIIDHVSVSWGTDENTSIGGLSASAPVRNVTYSKMLITEPGHTATRSYLGGTYTYNISLVNNYFSHARDRNPMIGYGIAKESTEVVNNVIYRFEGGTYVAWGNYADILGNVYKTDKKAPPPYPVIVYGRNKYNNPNALITDGKIHIADNHLVNSATYWISSDAKNSNQDSRVLKNSLIKNWDTSRSAIEDSVLKDVGNNIYQDSVDKRVIQDYYNGTGIYLTTYIHPNGWPNKPSTKRPSSFDTDNDGMSDEWERARWSNLTQDASGDDDNDGYTNIEEYFHSLAK